ncbi:J domain-containing protein [Haloparvum sp. AD34]
MVVDIASPLPPWLAAGVVMGLLATLVVVAVFVLGDRILPAARQERADRVDGKSRRHAQIRRYLQRIDEPYAERATVDGVAVAFYLPARDVALTFDVKAFFRLEATATQVVLCEHELTTAGLGRRLPFEVPEPEPAEPEPADPVAAAFDVLGLSKSADVDEVKRAYRERVKEVHPDQGGDEAEFKRVREAYATARNHCD